MYTATLHDKFNVELIKEFSNPIEVLVKNHYNTWLKDDANHGDVLTMYCNGRCIETIIVNKN